MIEEKQKTGNGTNCPICGSRGITRTNEDGNQNTQWEEMQCDQCLSTWTNVWKFDGQTDVEDSGNPVVDEDGY